MHTIDDQNMHAVGAILPLSPFAVTRSLITAGRCQYRYVVCYLIVKVCAVYLRFLDCIYIIPWPPARLTTPPACPENAELTVLLTGALYHDASTVSHLVVTRHVGKGM